MLFIMFEVIIEQFKLCFISVVPTIVLSLFEKGDLLIFYTLIIIIIIHFI